jgi:hypothetical protein
LLGGALLVFRRTATLGALVVVAVMSNVVMLNFCYDVPVKLFSMTLLIAAGYVAAPRLSALFDVLVRGRAVPAAPRAPLFTRPRLDLAARIFGIAFALYAAYDRGHTRWMRARDSAAARANPSPLAGLWDVEEFVRDGKVIPATLDEATRWRRLVLRVSKKSGVLAFRQVDDFYDLRFFDLDKDPNKKTFIFDGPPSFKWQYTQPDPEHLTLAGDYAGHTLAMKLHRRTVREHRLETRGFHWINEEPYNR